MTDAIRSLLQSRLSVGAGRVVGGQVPTAPSARPSARPGPKPFEQQELFPVRRVTDVSDEAIDAYAADEDDGDGGYSGTGYPITGAKPLDLTVTPFVRGTDLPEDVPGSIPPGFNTAYAGQLIEQAFGFGGYKYNSLTGRVERDDLKTIGMALPGAIGFAAGIGSALNKKNLERIARKADAQEEGFALGMLQGRIVGVSPAPVGSGYVLSGVLPQNLSPKQRQTIAEQLLGISQRSRAEFAKEQEERQRRIDESQATQQETDAGAGLFQPGDEPAKPNPRVNVPDTSYSGDESQYGAGSGGGGGSYFSDLGGGQSSDPGHSYTSYEPSGGGGSSDREDRESDIAGGGGPPSGGGSYGAMDSTGGSRRFASGGNVNPIQGNGFVKGSPDNYTRTQTVADDENRQVREGSFVLNAPTVERLQQAGMLPKGVDNSDKNATIKANKGGLMDVALSKGEYVIEPEEAQRIGYSFLEKLNDQGKAEVDRRQAAADGGFINGYQEGGKTLPTVLPKPSPVRQAYVGEDIDRPEIPLTDNMIAQFEVYNNSKKQRKDVENLINALNDRENLALVALAETTAETDDVEAMMGVQTTVLNRVRSQAVKPEKYPLVRRDFKDVTDVKSALKQRTPGRGSGSFMFQYDGFEPKYLSPKINSVLKGQVPAFAITKIMASSANVLDPEAQFGEGLFPDTVTFYTREDAPLAKDMELNPQMRYVTTLGGHDFYSYEAAPESPDEEKIYKEYLAEKRKKKKN